MILIVCIDDNKGMMFNHRRQSQDGVLRRHILDMVGNGKLWMNEYSGKMFAKDSEELLHGPVQTDEDFLKKGFIRRVLLRRDKFLRLRHVPGYGKY